MEPSSAMEELSWWEWMWTWFFRAPPTLPPGEALLRAAQNGDMRRVNFLLSHGVAPDQTRSVRGETALILAAANGHVEAATKLMEAGADPGAEDFAGDNAVTKAAAGGHTEIIAHIAARKPEVLRSEAAAMGLRLACQGGHSTAVAALLEGGVSPDARPRGFPSAVFVAATTDPASLSELIDAGANINEADGRGWTPLHHASSANEHTCVRILLASDANLFARDHAGRTPIDLAVTDFCRRLLMPMPPLAGAAPPHANGSAVTDNPGH